MSRALPGVFAGEPDVARELIDGTTWLGGNPYAG